MEVSFKKTSFFFQTVFILCTDYFVLELWTPGLFLIVLAKLKNTPQMYSFPY